MLTQERLKELLDYNPETGIFVWKIGSTNGMRVKGTKAGHIKKNGYVEIRVGYKNYSAHRLAFLYMEGYLPEGQVDHEDRIKDHNWWNNLREASPQCQTRNTGLNSLNTSGVKGVNWNSCRKKWYVQIKLNGKQKFLGSFSDFNEAAAHRFAIEQCIGWVNCDINSSAGSYLKGR